MRRSPPGPPAQVECLVEICGAHADLDVWVAAYRRVKELRAEPDVIDQSDAVTVGPDADADADAEALATVRRSVG